MRLVRRTVAALGVTLLATVGITSVASAQEYTPDVDVAGITQTDPVAVSAGTLPYTGTDSSLPMAEIGVGLLAAGGLMVVAVRRRQAGAEA